jgi:cell division protein FtsQ
MAQLSLVASNNVEGNLFTLDINDLQEEFRQIPWVKQVTIFREFPNSITVGVSEYTAVAKLGANRLISADGKVFNGTANSMLPVFTAPEQNISEALTDYQLIGRILHDRQVQINKLAINGLGITKVDFSNNLHVVICGTDIEGQVKLLDQYWDKLYDLNPGLSYVNMCYKNALAINEIKPTASGVAIMPTGEH